MNVKCIELQTGRVRWVHRPIAWPTMIVADDKLLIQTLNGELILADASPDEYREYGRIDVLPGRCWTVPAMADGKLYCRNNRGMIVCLAVQGESPRLVIVDSPPDPAADGPKTVPEHTRSAKRPATSPRPKTADLHWPRFRGLAGSGLSSRADTPTKWNGRTGQGILWKKPVPLPGYSSPVAWY